METGNEGTNKEKDVVVQEDLFKLIQQQNEQMAELKKQLDEVQKNKNSTIDENLLQKLVNSLQRPAQVADKDEEITPPEDDYQEEGVRFCAPAVGYVLVDDKRRGVRSVNPWNKKALIFRFASSRRVRQGKYEALSVYSVYTSHSKAEIEWIREHTLYGIWFFESSMEAINADAVKAMKLANIYSVLKEQDYNQLLKTARDYGVKHQEDVHVLRMNLAHAMADVQMRKEEEASQQRIREMTKEGMLVERIK